MKNFSSCNITANNLLSKPAFISSNHAADFIVRDILLQDSLKSDKLDHQYFSEVKNINIKNYLENNTIQ